MSSHADLRQARGSAIAALLAATTLSCIAGCYESHPCGDVERCNLRDDDCDHRIDEGFVDDDGAYRSIEACGSCGVDCNDAFPSAGGMVECADDCELGPLCRIVLCPPGFHLAGDGACVPDVPVLCLPCTTDVDCELRIPGAACLETATGAMRCGQPCGRGAMSGCPDGFECAIAPGDGMAQCVPISGICACGEDTEDALLACLLESGDPSHRCAGVQRCGADGPSMCEPALEEACNAQDDDCDGATDEDFRDDAGRFVARLHCGGCAIPCVEPGPNMLAQCLPDGAAVRCDIECLEGFVDVDRILANGCECERWDGEGPPPAVGGDANCDGLPDDTTDFVYVSVTGSDTNPGSLARPMRSLAAGQARAQAEGKDVLVSRGIYDGAFALVAGVSVFGGYSPDFRDRDLELFQVLIERTDAEPGTPPLTCRAITAPTRVEGFVVQGSDATREGTGSTAISIDGCGPAVRFAAITVLAARGADGVRGVDSSTNLRDWGFATLTQLDGRPGSDGAPGNTEGMMCRRVEGGSGGRQTCRAVDIGGGRGGAAECPGNICTNGSACANAGCTDFTSGGVCDIDRVLSLATPNPAAEPGRGPSAGAAGELSFNAPTNRGVCNFCDDNPTLLRDGGNGADGATGGHGARGVGCGIAPVVDAAGRVAASDGTDGVAGRDGSGGGGGTSGGGYEVIGGTSGGCTDRSGGSGGGGGSGGCGAPQADGGEGGGYSIGVLVRGAGAGPTFEESVRIVTASAGDGGDGGVGAAGGAGGTGASGGMGRFWCARTGGRGGDGGRGGAGGGGGGGCGGGSHGVYIVGAGSAYRDLVASTVTIESTGVAGRGGRGGFSPGEAGTDGSDGGSETVLLAP